MVIKKNGDLLNDIFRKTDEHMRPKSQGHDALNPMSKVQLRFRQSLDQQGLRQFVEKPRVNTFEFKGVNEDKVLLNKIENSI